MNTFFISDLHIGHENIIKFTEDSYTHGWEIVGDNIQMLIGNEVYSWKQIQVPKSMEEWKDRIKKNWNSKVKDKDHVYILGDLSMKNRSDLNEVFQFLAELNGIKYLIPGNHDDELIKKIYSPLSIDEEKLLNKSKLFLLSQIEEISVPMPGNLPARKLVLSHYPIYSFKSCGFNSTLLFGHIHNMYNQNRDFLEVLKKGIWTYREDLKLNPAKAYNVGCMTPWMDFTPKTLSEIEDFDKHLI